MKQFTPRPYQGEIIDFILNNSRCAVFAGMGTGKTVATLTALSTLLLLEGGPVLVLAPKRVATSVWPQEARLWQHTSHLRIQPITGAPADRRASLNVPADVYTTNYEQLPWLIEELGASWPFRIVVADESTRLKSFRLRQGGQRARSLAQVAHTRIKRFIELTGTPAPNGLADLWGQMWFIDAGARLGKTFTIFTERWFRPNRNGFGVEPMASAQAEIQQALSDISLTVRAEDHFDLQKPIVTDVAVDLPPTARGMYRSMERELYMQLENHEITAANAAAKSMKLLQIASGAVYLTIPEGGRVAPLAWEELHKAKLEALDSIIEEASGAPVLVAYHFKSDRERLQQHIKKARVLDTNPKTIEDWNAGRIPVLLAHPQSAGHGLNLQHGGNILVFFSHSWSLENRQQIIERIGPVRQAQAGYKRPVWIYNIVARDTLDTDVIARVDSKRAVQDELLDALRKRHTSS